MRPFLLLIIFISFALPAEVFRTVDEDGNVTFTDSPPDKDAEVIEIEETNTMKFRSNPAAYRGVQNREPEAVSYSISIVSPENDAQFRNPQEPIQIKAEVIPGLQRGAKLQLTHNGELHSEGRKSSWAFPSLFRGSHTFVASVVDDDGKILAQSAAVTIHVFRHSVLLGPQKREADRLAAEQKAEKEKPGAIMSLVGLLLPGGEDEPAR